MPKITQMTILQTPPILVFKPYEFYKLKKESVSSTETFSIMHTIICYLEGNFDILEILLHNLDYNFDVIAPTETWHVEQRKTSASGHLGSYSKYEGLPGSSKKGGCGFYIKKTITYINKTNLHIRSLKRSG